MYAETEVRALYTALRRRRRIAGDPHACEALDRRLSDTIRRAATACLPDVHTLDAPPPRRVAIAMAMALLAYPHIRRTAGLDVLLPEAHVLTEALGLTAWELDDLTEEIDRRVSEWVHQRTLVEFLRTRYPSDILYQLLLPAASAEGATITFLDRHLLARGPESKVLPLFTPHAVDPALYAAVSKGLGYERADSIELLQRTLWIVGPGEQSRPDPWRTDGWAHVTGFGVRHGATNWMTRPLMRGPSGELEHAFQPELLRRLSALLECTAQRQLGASLARREVPPSLFDIGDQLAETLAPLLAWIRSDSATRQASRTLSLSTADARARLEAIGADWQQQRTARCDPAPESLLESSLASWLSRPLALQAALEDLDELKVEAFDPRPIAHLFVGFFLSETPQTLQHAPSTSPGVVLKRWFEPVWNRVLAEVAKVDTGTHHGLIFD